MMDGETAVSENAEQAVAFVHHIASDWRKANLDSANRALCAFAVKLTRTPEAMTEADLQLLRQQGFDDRAIHDATQIISYFNYINRIADALGVEPETFIRAWGEDGLATPTPHRDKSRSY